MQLDVLAVIPDLAEASEAGGKPVILGKESSLVEFEAFRNLRMEIITRMEKVADSKVLAVLSPFRGEGKTTVSVNLARAIAMEGRRVLIIDADMRRPQLSSLLTGREGPGIEDVPQAMGAGFSTGSSLGHGLPGSKRLVDEFKMESEVGAGTSVEVIKWQ